MDLNHVIVAMKGDRIVKVQCLTCKKEHTYRAPKGVTNPQDAPKPNKTESEAATAVPVEAEWEKLMLAHQSAPTKPYGIKGHFILGDKIHHPTFGDGIVGKLIYPNKIEVIFKMDVKVLIHAGA
jgi:hypothetical protein